MKKDYEQKGTFHERKRMIAILLGVLCILHPLLSYSFLSILDSGEPISSQQIHLGFTPQLITAYGSGSNAIFSVKSGIDEGKDFTGQIGFGDIDFWATVATRWIPIPDYLNQPALGIRFDATLARENHLSLGIMRLAPFLSKQLRTEVGQVEPYIYLPFGFKIQEGQYDQVSSLVTGTKLQIEDLRPIYFYGEICFNVRNQFSYIAVGIFSAFDRKTFNK